MGHTSARRDASRTGIFIWRTVFLVAAFVVPLSSHGPAGSVLPAVLLAKQKDSQHFGQSGRLMHDRLRGGSDIDYVAIPDGGASVAGGLAPEETAAAVRFERDSAGSTLLTADGGVRKMVTRSVRTQPPDATLLGERLLPLQRAACVTAQGGLVAPPRLCILPQCV
jgi:hypothetical protein